MMILVLMGSLNGLLKGLRVWTERGIGHALPCGLRYGLPVVRF